MTVPVERVIGPAKPFRLLRVMVVVPVEPEANEIVVGLTVKLKSVTTTLILTTPESVSGLPAGSEVA